MSTAVARNVERQILTPEASRFVSMLQREFNPRREELLARRERVKRDLDSGKLPEFPAETKDLERTFTITLAFEAKRVSA